MTGQRRKENFLGLKAPRQFSLFIEVIVHHLRISDGLK
jgi:hypothetical protein